MTSDVRDVLNLPDGGAGPRPSKKQKASAPKPNLKGLAREVHLLGGDNPIAIVPEPIQFKKRRLASRKPVARWNMRPFRNTGRADQSLILHHWRRQETKEDAEGAPQESAETTTDEMEDSTYSKYSVRVSVPQYSDDQYRQHLQNDEWSREETDYLMGLVQDLDIRWPVIWDRYEWTPPATNGEANADGDESKAVVPATRSRTMEDLKARYYEVASKMMAAQKPVQYMSQSEFALHELMAHFNPQQEKARKDFAMNSLLRSGDEAREEESLLLEVKRILARSERFNEERRELYNRLDYPRTETDIGSFKSSSGLQTLLQNLMSADKSKKRKSIMGTDGVSPGAAAGPQPALQESSKRDSIATASAGAHRDSTGAAATPSGGSKKAQQQQQSQPQAQQQQQQQPNQPQQQQQQERRKLNEHEAAIYGVAHFDRLGSGPTFRTEKINKLFSHKSNQQQTRINNMLNELDVPSKLAMATAATTQQYEQLLAAVNGLLEARKLSDKLDAEIKLERAKKAERERAPPESERATQNGETKEQTTGDGASGGGHGGVVDRANGVAAAAGDPVKKDEKEEKPTAPTKGNDCVDVSKKKLQTGGNEGADATEGEREAGSGAPQKRSASVLSTTSDKSTKRQRK